jgi:elongation factor G
LSTGQGYEFVNDLVGGAIPKEYIPAIEEGARGALESGFLAGYPLVDIRVKLVSGSHHEVDSSGVAFRIAAALAVREAVKRGNPVVLEPVMGVEVVVPEAYTGGTIGDLNARRAQIEGMEPRAEAFQAVRGLVPLAEMFGYATDLRSMTQGRGTFTMEFDHYAELSAELAEEMIGVVVELHRSF